MNKIFKVSGVVVSIMLAGSVTMGDQYPGGSKDQKYVDRGSSKGRSESSRNDRGRGDSDRGGSRGYSDTRSDRGSGHYESRSSYRGYSDGGRQCGYSRNSGGELVVGLIGLGIAAAVLGSMSHSEAAVVQQPVYVQPEPRVVYAQPQQVVYVQPVAMVINVQNSNGSMTPVTLRQVGNQWVGPRGEYYNNLPTVGDLRGVYGF